MNILLIGLSHKTAPVEIRERLAFTPAMLRSALTHFDANHQQAHLEEVHEGIILTTCNRLEVYAAVGNLDVASQAIIEFLSRSCDIPSELFTDYLYFYQNEAAVSHLLRVGSGLDSMVFSIFELKSSKSPPNLILMKSIFSSCIIGLCRFFYQFQKVNTYPGICKDGSSEIPSIVF